MVLDEHDLLARLDIALDEVLQAVVLGRGAHIYKRLGQRVGHQRAVGDGARGNAGNDLGITKVLHNQARHFHLDQVAHLGVGEGHSQVGIYGGLPSCGPGKRTVGLQFDGVDLYQFLGQ